MLRLVGFFIATLVVLNLLRAIPFVGEFFHGFFAFWIVAILLALGMSKLADSLLRRRKLQNSIRALGAVDRPHNHGKLGALLVSQRSFRTALPHLEQACEGEPDFPEWHYRRGLALLALGRGAEAVDALARAIALAPDHAYGNVQIALARAHLAQRDAERALAALELFDRGHGPSPESAYWRGKAQQLAGRKAEARESFREVGQLAAQGARFQRRDHRVWQWRAWLAQVV